jgi:uncharacterized protein (TIGR02466 family)
MSRVDLQGLFPTPFMRVERLLPEPLIARCTAWILATATETNARSDRLRHTGIADPADAGPLQEVQQLVAPHLVQFGRLLFGEDLGWQVKEIWTNVLETGGHQALHSHSNSFISGVLYLTATHASARTVFHRGIGGREFIFSNENDGAEIGPFNATKWVSPAAEPGDLVLFPSYMLHEVPPNAGGQRISVALNAIPDRLDTWGYAVRFTSHRSMR